MDAYEDLIDIQKDNKKESNRTIMPFFFIKPNESYNVNYAPIKLSQKENDSSFPKFPFPNDFENYESFSQEAKNWMDKTMSTFLKNSKAPLLPVPTTLFYRTFNLEFWPNDKNTLRSLAKKLGPLLLPLRPKNLLELQDKIFNSPTNITNTKYNSNEEEIFKDENNFSEPDYNGRPLPYKYHFVQNDFFQLIPPEPLPEYYDTFEQYNKALQNWYKITNEKYPGYKKIRKVEELGNELGIKPEISNPILTPFHNRKQIDKLNEENRKKLFNKNSKTCTIDQLNSAFDVSLSQSEFTRLTSLNTQTFESTFNLFSNKCNLQINDSMTKIRNYCFNEETFNILNENNYDEIGFIIDDLIEFGPNDYVTKAPIQNYDISTQIIFIEPNLNQSTLLPKNDPNYIEFPLFLLNNETPDQFIQNCEDRQIDFSVLIRTSEEFSKFIKLCDYKDRTLCQKFVYIFKNLLSSPAKFDIYVKPLIGKYDKNDCYSFDLTSHKLLKTFLKIVEGAGEFDDERIPRMMYNLSIDIDEDSYAKKKGDKYEYNRREVLKIYKLCSRCSSLYAFTVLFSFKKWNSNIIFEYVTDTILNPLLYQLSKKVQLFKKDIVACYINDTVGKLDKNIKKAKENEEKIKEDEKDDANIGYKLMSFSSAFLSFSDASKSLSEQFVIPTRKSQLRIPIFVLNQDLHSSKKVSTIDDNQINDNKEKTLAALSNQKTNSPQPPNSSEKLPSLIDDEKVDQSLKSDFQNEANRDDAFNFENIIQNIEEGDPEYPSHFIIGSQGKDDVENTINSLHHSISAMSQSFKSLPKIEKDDDDDNDDDDYMKILTKTKGQNSTVNDKKSKKKKKKKKSKKAKDLAYRIIFMIINIDYRNLHQALFYPSPINFFNEISKLENDNAFMNLAGGFFNKTEKLKSCFLSSFAFKNLVESIINFDVNKLDLTTVNFAQRALLILNRCQNRVFSRAQLTALFKSFTANVSRFNFALCPTIALHFRNRERFIYKTTIISDSKSESARNSGRFLSSVSSLLASSNDQNTVQLETASSKKNIRKPPLISREDQLDIESSIPTSVPPMTSSFRSSFRFRKDKASSSTASRSSRKKSSMNEESVTFNQNEVAIGIPATQNCSVEQYESKARSFDPRNSGVDLDNINNGVGGLSSSFNSTSFQRRDQVQIHRQRRLSSRKNSDSIFGLGGIRMSWSSCSVTESDNSSGLNSIGSVGSSNGLINIAGQQVNGSGNLNNSLNNGSIGERLSGSGNIVSNSDSFLMDDQKINTSMQPLKPQYAGDDWINDATMVATYLASLVYSVNSACFPYLLRAVDLLFCSSRIIFPRKFWGTFCGALSVAEVNSWLFLRTIFKLGYVQVLPAEFTLFFPAVFNYKCPYVNIHEEKIDKNEKKSTSNALASPSTANNGLTFENLNQQIEKAKQLSLKIMMFAAVISSSAEVSLQFLDALVMSDRGHLQKIFSKSVNPSLKIEKLNSSNNQKKAVNTGNDVKSSINISFYSSSYKASLSNIVEKNLANYRKIVKKLKSYGIKFQNLISIFPVS